MRQILPDGIYNDGAPPPPLPALRVVLTRFNMQLPGFREAGGLMDESEYDRYIEARLPHFRSICLASLHAQTARPDAWLIGFDAGRRGQVQPVLDLISAEKWIVPVWQETIDGRPSTKSVFVPKIKELLRPEHEWVISTRIDNDDALNRWHCEAVAVYAASVVRSDPAVRDFWVSFPLGVMFNGQACKLFPQTNNAFLSRCEHASLHRGNAGHGALHRDHQHVFQHGTVWTPATQQPMWLQNVHGRNLKNVDGPDLLVFRDTALVLQQFGIGGDRPPLA